MLFLVKGRGIPTDKCCAAPLSHITLVPTILELLDQPPTVWCDGRYELTVNLLTSYELYDLADDPYEMQNRITGTSLLRCERGCIVYCCNG